MPRLFKYWTSYRISLPNYDVLILRARGVNSCLRGRRSDSRTWNLSCALPAPRWWAEPIPLFATACMLPISGGWMPGWIPFGRRAIRCWTVGRAWSRCPPARSETLMLTSGGLRRCASRLTFFCMITLMITQRAKPTKSLCTIPTLIRHFAGVETLMNTEIVPPRIILTAYVTRILGSNWHTPGWSLRSRMTGARTLPAWSAWFFGTISVLAPLVTWMTHAGCSVGDTWLTLLVFSLVRGPSKFLSCSTIDHPNSKTMSPVRCLTVRKKDEMGADRKSPGKSKLSWCVWCPCSRERICGHRKLWETSRERLR